MTTTVPALGPWVETRTERCRGGRSTTIAVNTRDHSAVFIDDPDRELFDTLTTGGYLAGGPRPPAAPRTSLVVRFLRTFDVHWSGADRFVAAVHRSVGRHFWNRRGLVAQVALAIAGVVATLVAFRSGRPLELRPTSWHLPAYLGLSLLAIAVHELGHGVVLTHHGRRVSSIGFRLHLGSPAFYVESVEALLLTRRQRLVQAAAGLWVEWQLVSLVALALWCTPASALTPVLHRFLILSVVTVATNLLPFAGLDGSLLLADLVREPNLAADAAAAVRRRRHDRRRGDGFLVVYAVVNTLVATVLFVSSFGLWFLLFGPLLRTLLDHGVLGAAGAAGVLLVSFGPAAGSLVRWSRRFLLVDRVVFRLERRRRVRATEQIASMAAFAALDERALGVLAGQLSLRRVGRGAPLHEAGFRGHLVVDRAVLVDTGDGPRPFGGGVHRVEGAGLAVSRRGVRRCDVALLSERSAALVQCWGRGPVSEARCEISR